MLDMHAKTFGLKELHSAYDRESQGSSLTAVFCQKNCQDYNFLQTIPKKFPVKRFHMKFISQNIL